MTSTWTVAVSMRSVTRNPMRDGRGDGYGAGDGVSMRSVTRNPMRATVSATATDTATRLNALRNAQPDAGPPSPGYHSSPLLEALS